MRYKKFPISNIQFQMGANKHKRRYKQNLKSLSFSQYISQPHIALSMIVLALIALLFSVMEFSQVINY